MAAHPETPLQSDAFRADPRIAQARQLIAEALADHQSKLTDVRPTGAAAADANQKMLDRFGKARGGATFWPYLSAGLGNGPFVELADGSVKLDFIGGIGVHGSGHSHASMVDAAIDAAIEDTVMQGNLQQHPPSLTMSERMVKLACESGANLQHCLLSTSGAMANENALKIAMHYQSLKHVGQALKQGGQSTNHDGKADRIIAFDNAFAGRTLALAALTDRPNYRMGLPLTIDVDYLPFLDPHSPAKSQRWAVDELKRLLDRHPGRYAAFWAEPIAGEGGYYGGSHEFFRALCEPLREAGVPIIFDEVQSFSRTSRPFAFQHYGLDEFADIVTVGKITQVCVTLFGEKFKPKGPILSQTFTGSSSMISCGLKMLDLLDEAECFGENSQNMARHEYFVSRLESLQQKYPDLIRGPYGEGMMIAFTPGDGSFDQAKTLMETMYEIGILGFVCGADPVRIRFLPPPAITTNDHIDAAIELLDQSLQKFAGLIS
ncbi:aminotransferase class III-fold pyridoxal phosphate-dependent enzyme [Rubripirellula obstinata]|uniref:aminotransferase class III-fold pyridoxal phosphate-dependent enzyme n=1 Tax=Rubripirellula obstinata TaxID=406547 RepID=UPI001EE3CD55|nr:aminotransferase class III-fold pyridoxal phosphate-dependent enzyme [Rubripirellula obstinata]